ncbi:hypothetical protein D3C71_1985900 [compost metagenome]
MPAQRGRAALDLHSYMMGLAHGMTAQRLFDAFLHVGGRCLLVHPDAVDHADHTAQLAYRAFRQVLLVAPIDIAR